MSTKNYIAFAELFACLADVDGYTAEEMRQKIAREATALFILDNPLFNSERFLKAAKVPLANAPILTGRKAVDACVAKLTR